MIHEQAHQLGDGHHRVGVVDVHRLPGRELAQVVTGLQETRQDALQRGADEEVLLLESQLLAGGGVVVWVENLGDGLVQGLFLHRAQIIPVVEVAQIERVARHGTPQDQGIGHAIAKAGNQGLVGQGRDGILRDPLHPQVPPLVLSVDGMPTETDRVDLLGPRGLPGVAEEQPVVRALHLVAVADLLAEHAVLVTDAVTAGGEALGSERIEKTGRQATQAAVAQAGVVLLLVDVLEHHAQPADGLTGLLLQIQIEHGVLQGPPGEEFQRQVVDPLGAQVAVALLRAQPVAHQPAAHRQRQAVVFVVRPGTVGLAPQGQAHRQDALISHGEPGRGRRAGLGGPVVVCHFSLSPLS